MTDKTIQMHRNAEAVAGKLELIGNLAQLCADALKLSEVIELDHARQTLQFAADKAWENLCNAKTLAAQLLQDSQQGGEG